MFYHSITRFVLIFESLFHSDNLVKWSVIYDISPESVVLIMHDQNIICSKTSSNRGAFNLLYLKINVLLCSVNSKNVLDWWDTVEVQCEYQYQNTKGVKEHLWWRLVLYTTHEGKEQFEIGYSLIFIQNFSIIGWWRLEMSNGFPFWW